MYLVPKCLWYRNFFGTEMSPVPKCPGTEKSRYQNVSGAEMSWYRNVSGTEMSRYRNVHGTEMSRYRNVSGTKMSVPKCLMPKSLGPKCETATIPYILVTYINFQTKMLSGRGWNCTSLVFEVDNNLK